MVEALTVGRGSAVSFRLLELQTLDRILMPSGTARL